MCLVHRLPFFPSPGSLTVIHRANCTHPIVNFHHTRSDNAIHHLSNQFNNTTRLLDLLLSIPAEVTGADNDRDLRNTALAEDLRVSEGEEIDDRGGVSLLAAEVGFALLSRYEGPKLYKATPISKHVHRNVIVLSKIPSCCPSSTRAN